MDKKIPENDIKVESKGAAALENFWYYHKWKVIVSLFVAFVIGVCVWSCLAKPKIDISLLYVGSFDPMDAATQEMTETLSKIEPSSVGTNGVGLNMLDRLTRCKDLLHKGEVCTLCQAETRRARNGNGNGLVVCKRGDLV